MFFRRRRGSDVCIPTTVALSPHSSDEDEDHGGKIPPPQPSCKLTIQAAIRKRDRLGIVRVKVPDYSSEFQVPASIICVIDRSERGDISQFHLIIRATKKVIKTLGPNDQIALITYSEDAEIILPFIKMSPVNKEMALQTLLSIQPQGRPNLWSGLLSAIRLASEVTADIFLLCGSEPEIHPPRGELETFARCKLKHSYWSCRVSTFGFGYNINSKLLHDLAAEGDGQFCFIPDASFVGTVFMSATANILSAALYTSFLNFDEIHKNPWIEQTFHTEEVDDSSSRICLYLPSLAFGQTLDFLVSHEIGMYPKCRELEGTHPGPSNFVTSLDIEIARLRGRLVSMIHTAEEQFERRHPQALQLGQEACEELIDEVNSAIDKFSGIDSAEHAMRFQALKADLMGNIKKAYSREDWHEKWGRHYVLSLARGHELQRTTNFKDPGLQVYATRTLCLIRGMADEEINKKPENQPWFEPSEPSDSHDLV